MHLLFHILIQINMEALHGKTWILSFMNVGKQGYPFFIPYSSYTIDWNYMLILLIFFITYFNCEPLMSGFDLNKCGSSGIKLVSIVQFSKLFEFMLDLFDEWKL